MARRAPRRTLARLPETKQEGQAEEDKTMRKLTATDRKDSMEAQGETGNDEGKRGETMARKGDIRQAIEACWLQDELERKTNAALRRLRDWHVARAGSNGNWHVANAAQIELDKRRADRGAR